MKYKKHSQKDNIKRSYEESKSNIYTDVSNEIAEELNIRRNSDTKGYNDKHDAFRHAYTSALVASRWGSTISKVGGTINEWKNYRPWKDFPEHEAWMDEFNNSKGREIKEKIQEEDGNEEDLKFSVKKALENGDLVTTPYDPRRTYEKHVDWEKAKLEAQELMQKDKMRMTKEAKDRNGGSLSKKDEESINSRFNFY